MLSRSPLTLVFAVVVLFGIAACSNVEEPAPVVTPDAPHDVRSWSPCSGEEPPDIVGEAVIIDTNMGDITVELFGEQAPATVDNFLAYVDQRFYEDTVFHRVISGFMIQGGGLTADLQHKATRRPVANEADNGLTNDCGTIAMARLNDPHSATSQFFINLVDNTFLNHDEDNGRAGYTVFGRVIEGMDVVEAIGTLETGKRWSYEDVPNETVLIENVYRAVAD